MEEKVRFRGPPGVPLRWGNSCNKHSVSTCSWLSLKGRERRPASPCLAPQLLPDVTWLLRCPWSILLHKHLLKTMPPSELNPQVSASNCRRDQVRSGSVCLVLAAEPPVQTGKTANSSPFSWLRSSEIGLYSGAGEMPSVSIWWGAASGFLQPTGPWSFKEKAEVTNKQETIPGWVKVSCF